MFNKSISDPETYELPEPESNKALHFTPFTLIIATGYVTLASVVVNIGSLVSDILSHMEVWCLLLHFRHVLLLLHSEALCLAPVQLKHSFFSLSNFLRSLTVFTILQSEDL